MNMWVGLGIQVGVAVDVIVGLAVCVAVPSTDGSPAAGAVPSTANSIKLVTRPAMAMTGPRFLPISCTAIPR